MEQNKIGEKILDTPIVEVMWFFFKFFFSPVLHVCMYVCTSWVMIGHKKYFLIVVWNQKSLRSTVLTAIYKISPLFINLALSTQAIKKKNHLPCWDCRKREEGTCTGPLFDTGYETKKGGPHNQKMWAPSTFLGKTNNSEQHYHSAPQVLRGRPLHNCQHWILPCRGKKKTPRVTDGKVHQEWGDSSPLQLKSTC